MAACSTDDEREEEISAVTAIFPELVIDPSNPFAASIDIPVEPSSPLSVTFPAPVDGAPPTALLAPPTSDHAGQNIQQAPALRDIHQLSYLPPLHLQVTLPDAYPAEKAPHFELSTSPKWIPQSVLENLQGEGAELWEEYGHGQVVFAYIDFLQQAAERAFDLADKHGGVLEVAQDLKIELLDFDIKEKRKKFEQETFECGICLEPKKGSSCYRLLRCGHVFCVPCLQHFYNTCITEGDVASVRCLAPDCGKEGGSVKGMPAKRTKKERTLNPSELLQIPLEQATVQRYVELKRKKKLESDKTTIYCPRKWCQGAARSKKYPKMTDLSQIANFDDSDSEAENNTQPPQTTKESPDQIPSPADRLAICEDCNYAFCRICLGGWHGEFVRCWPRSASELTEEERASYDYIRLHTSPCPTCASPCQKTHGCNHMNCFQCHTHFCYLCGAWLDPQNPYHHFNQKQIGCYMRLWELEEGDDGTGEVRFEGARGWEAAIAAADEADAAELARNPDAGQGANRHAARDLADILPLPQAPVPPRAPVDPPLVVAMAQMNVREPPPPPPRNNAPAAAPIPRRLPMRGGDARGPGDLGAARAAHGGGGRAAAQEPARQGLQRFLQMVQDDEEDGWDSDELDEEDGEWEIPER